MPPKTAPTIGELNRKANAGTLTADDIIAYLDKHTPSPIGNPLGETAMLLFMQQFLDMLKKAKAHNAPGFAAVDVTDQNISVQDSRGTVHVYPIAPGIVNDPSIKDRIKDLWQHTGAPVVNTFTDALDALKHLVEALFDPAFWVRAFEFLIGLGLIGIGAVKLGSPNVASAVRQIPVYGKVLG